jgi:PAS domain S-box-containing protein
MSAELRLIDNYDIINSISNAVIATDVNGRILFLNRAAGEIYHLHTPPLQIGGLLLDSVSHQWKEIVKNLIDTTRIAKASSSLEAVYTIDGKKVFYDITCSPILTSDDDVGRIIFEFRDITLQKIYENKIGFVANDLTRLIETASALITIIDTRGFIVEWNDRAADITGYPKDEALAEHFSDLLLDSESKGIFDQIFSESISGALITNKELPIWTNNGQRLNLLVNASCRRNSDRKVVGMLLIGQNITELTDYRNALEEKVRDRTIALERALVKERELVEVKKRFVDIASHEFRAPISVINAQTRTLLESAALRSDSEAL